MMAQIMSTNIGPNGATKLLEGEEGELTLTKDGGDLIRQLTIINPTAMYIARAALAQEKAFHDGVSSLVVFLDALLAQSEFHLSEGVHPRIIVNGLHAARDEALSFIDTLTIDTPTSRSELRDVANSAALTKCPTDISDVVVDSILCIQEENQPIDLDRIEVMRIKSSQKYVKLVKGLIIDQGFRHPLMAKRMKNVCVCVINFSLELEDTAVKTFIPVANADQRERLTKASRKFVDEKVKTIIELRDAIEGDFLLVNGKGIDAPSMDILAHAKISALRRVSKKNLMRLTHACGCRIVNFVDDLRADYLGYAGVVYEETHKGDNKYIFIDEVKEPKAVSIAIAGATEMNSKLVETAIRDGLRSLKNAHDDKKLLPGAGAFEIALAKHMQEFKKTVDPPLNRIGVDIFAEALLSIPRTLLANSGLDQVEVLSEMQQEAEEGELAGVDLDTGEVIDPTIFGIFDNYCVKRGIIQASPIVASQLLLVDQIIQSGKVKKPEPKEQAPKPQQ